MRNFECAGVSATNPCVVQGPRALATLFRTHLVTGNRNSTHTNESVHIRAWIGRQQEQVHSTEGETEAQQQRARPGHLDHTQSCSHTPPWARVRT